MENKGSEYLLLKGSLSSQEGLFPPVHLRSHKSLHAVWLLYTFLGF